MRKLFYIFAAIIGLGLGACDITDPTTGDQTEIPETPQESEDPGQGDGTDDPEGSDDPEEQKKGEVGHSRRAGNRRQQDIYRCNHRLSGQSRTIRTGECADKKGCSGHHQRQLRGLFPSPRIGEQQ